MKILVWILLIATSVGLTYCEPDTIFATPTSGRSMEVVSVADLSNKNSKPFTDRSYMFTDIGNYSPNCYFIRGANGDKNTDPSSVQTTLEVPFPSTVYLDFWNNHLERVSNWIDSWTEDTSRKPTKFSGYGPGTVMKREFESGTINLMGNNGNGRGTYYAFVCPKENGPSYDGPYPEWTNAKDVVMLDASECPIYQTTEYGLKCGCQTEECISLEDCQKACNTMPACNLTMFQPNGGGVVGGVWFRCWFWKSSSVLNKQVSCNQNDGWCLYVKADVPKCLTEMDISYNGNNVNDGLNNKQQNVESCRSSCRSMSAKYFDFNYGGNKGCYCKNSNAGRRVVRGVISGETMCTE